MSYKNAPLLLESDMMLEQQRRMLQMQLFETETLKLVPHQQHMLRVAILSINTVDDKAMLHFFPTI